ncbi:MAG TPA: ATP-binding protein [Ktedonobacteraceae bacterium]|nr:ATP-binding protein [Ktedonobacteraceae bacterium]
MQGDETAISHSIPLHAETPDVLLAQQEQYERKQLVADDSFQVITDALPLIDQKRTERQLMQQEQIIQLQTELIELAHDAILVRDLDSRIVSWNQGAETLYGWTVQEAVGQLTHTLLHTQFPESREAVDLVLIEVGYWEGRIGHINRNGKQLIVESRQVLTRDITGEPLAILEINRDITEQERLAHEQAEARAASLALQETARQMNEFLSVASHEFKTPLTTIKATIQLARLQVRRLQRAMPDETVANLLSLLERAERQVNIQNRLVNDLVDMSRIQTDHLELKVVPCNLVEIVHEIVNDQRTLVPTRTIRWETSILQAEVLADPDRVGQVVNNYLSNALKYSESDKPVEVLLERAEAMIRVNVVDQGPGLSSTEQEHIWDRFYRVKGVDVKSGSGVGLGLGLYICRTLIEQQGGQVGVESEPGRGSTFWFTLPLA